MSYILDALRKSETERRQGKIPDLGQQVQLIHKPRKKAVPAAVWVAVALTINAIVLAVIFWPGGAPATGESAGDNAEVSDTTPEDAASEVVTPVQNQQDGGQTSPPDTGAVQPETSSAAEEEPTNAISESGEAEPRLRPTVIVPNRTEVNSVPVLPEQEPTGRVPHLVELPLPFQKSIPDLIFNSHIYSSEPSARRVMINNQYMRTGDSFSGIRVERITEEGVVLSKNGRQFRVGVVRDWVSPR